ncbi:MAG: SdpI family protein [Acholeplasmatales bacterium]
MTILGLSPYWLITPVLFIIGGLLLLIKPPNKVNELYGYRTKRSKKTQIHWNLAQKISGRWLLIIGILLTIIARYHIICSS